MAAAATLSSSRAAEEPMSPSSPSRSKNKRMSAAADLIRNLDAALSGMTAAASSAAEDAARARRNARAAGEVARRYGGSSSAAGGRKKRGDGAAAGGSLLERKRERRAAARMAAEARQRREHPMSAYSPRLLTPRSSRGEIFFGEGRGEAERGAVNVATAESVAGGSNDTAKPDRRQNGGTMSSNAATTRLAQEARASGSDYSVTHVPFRSDAEHEAVDRSIAAPSSYPSVTLNDTMDTNATEFEDAMANVATAESVTGGSNDTAKPDRLPAGGTMSSNAATTRLAQEVRASGSDYSATHVPFRSDAEHEAVDRSIVAPSSHPSVTLTDTMDTNATEFEDAMENERISAEEPTNPDHPIEEQRDCNFQWAGEQQNYEETMGPEVADELRGQEVQAQPANNYYTQQVHYYQQQQHMHHEPDQGGARNQLNSERDPDEQQAPPVAPSLTVATSITPYDASAPAPPKPSPKRSIPPSPPRSQPMSTNRIEASHAEDVLTLSLELERVRSHFVSVNEQLSHATSQVTALQTRNDNLQKELTHVHSQLETHNERSSTQLSTLQERFDAEHLRANAAEEDAALALELAKEAQVSKEECEMWLSRSLEEIDLWKGRCSDLERQMQQQSQQTEQQEEEPKKSVRFEEDCPPSPVVSEDGVYDGEASPAVNASTAPALPNPPIGSPPQNTASVTSPAANNIVSAVISGVNSGSIFSSPTNTTANHETTPSKTAVASGRALLHRASPSPRKDAAAAVGGLSPHPRLQASELLKKSAETRRLLRDRLNTPPGGHGGRGRVLRPPTASPGAKRIQRVSSDPALNSNGADSSFASRQGAACKAVGRMIQASSARLKLNGKWRSSGAFLLTYGSVKDSSATPSEPVIEGVAQLESMVKDYCGGVEGTIGKQQEKIDELLAFCDHLEKEVMLTREED